MTMLGLLGAVAGGAGEGMQRRRQEQRAVDLKMLDQQLSRELADQQRKWDQADLQEERSYKESQLEKVSASLPAGMFAVPSGVKVTDTRRVRAGGSGSSAPGKLTAVQKEQIKELKEMRDKAYERYEDEAASPEARSRALREYQDADNQFRSLIGMPAGQQQGGGQPAPERDVDSFFGGFGVSTKGESQKNGTAQKEDEGRPAQTKGFRENWNRMSGFGDVKKPEPRPEPQGDNRRTARKAAQQKKYAELDAFVKTNTYQEAQSGNEKAKRAARAKLEEIRKGADIEMIKRINRILSGM